MEDAVKKNMRIRILASDTSKVGEALFIDASDTPEVSDALFIEAFANIEMSLMLNGLWHLYYDNFSCSDPCRQPCLSNGLL